MDELDIFNNSAIILEKKVPKKIISWLTILVIIFCFLTIVSFIEINIYKPIIGKYKNNSLEMYIDGFPINKKNILFANGKKLDYKILDKNLRIENNIIIINMLKGKTSLYKIIKSKWKEVYKKKKND